MEYTQEFLDQKKAEIKEIKAQIKKLKAQTAKDIAETARMRSEYEVLKAKNDQMLEELGWDKLTPAEYAWLRENYTKEFQYFKPTVDLIRQRYAERTQTKYEPLPIDPKFKGFEEFQILNGWLDLDGRYYPVKDFAAHDGWAWDYLTEKHGRLEAAEIMKKAGGGTPALEDLGWVRIMKWPGLDVKFVLDERKITSSQKDTLYLYCALHKVPLPFEKEY